MRPKTGTGRTNGSPHKIAIDRKYARLYAKFMLEHWGHGSGQPSTQSTRNVKKRKKLWHTRLRRHGKEECRADS